MNNYTKPRNDGSIAFGVIILGIGLVLLFRKFGLYIPDWVLTWPMILIAVGTYTLISQQFKSFFGSVVLFIGVYFLLRREFDLDLGLDQFIWPVGLIALGIYLITYKNREYKVIDEARKNWENSRKNKKDSSSSQKVESAEVVADAASSKQASAKASDSGFVRATGTAFLDRINEQVIFSGVNRKLMTKDFQGGKATVLFGGLDLDLTQVDFTGVVTLDLEVGFGGVKLIVPPHWDVRTEMSNLAAGLEDKRMFREGGVDTNKVLILKGTLLFSGLEIKSF
ncbi:MAG: cell wall-active antibiotics response protein [Algoriphagus sp.]|nr:cell wall-active antibiotics response protein [Algoriphagus sp.]